jgi:uncharacterized membrane protein YdfJ with MMPL/SSD domain
MTILPGVKILSTRGLSAASARHPWRTIAFWLIALVLAVAAIATMLEFTSEAEITAKPESEQAYDLLGERLPPQPPEEVVSELIVIRAKDPSLTVVDPRFERKVSSSGCRRPGYVPGR